MGGLDKKNYYLNSIALFGIGIACLGYVIFDRPFAELHIQPPFLDFPIFGGEILLFLCLCIFLLKGELRLGKKHYWVIGYFAFVLIKAFYGYSKFGPLAFRHAALFYYPAFIILAHSFYRKDFFDSKKNILLAVLILFVLTNHHFNTYWLVTCFTLIFILSYTYPGRTLRYLLLAVLFLVTPYKAFFATSRMMMVANFAAGIYLIAALYFILPVRKAVKAGIVVLGLGFILSALFWFSDRNSLVTLVRGDKILETFKEFDAKFKVKREKDLQAEKGDASMNARLNQVRVYNPEFLLNHNRSDRGQLVKGGDPKKFSPQPLNEARLYNPDPPLVPNYFQKAITGDEAVRENLQPSGKIRIYNPDPPISLDTLRPDRETAKEETVGTPKLRQEEAAYGNIIFRLLIWRDMLSELTREKPVLGFHFGKPLRSVSLETLKIGEIEWRRDGWIAAHNSYLHMIYRAGVIGLATIGTIFVVLFKMIRKSIQCRSPIGILLCGIIINWFVAANFLLILELPYTAVPIWALFGMTYAYLKGLKPPGLTVKTGK